MLKLVCDFILHFLFLQAFVFEKNKGSIEDPNWSTSSFVWKFHTQETKTKHNFKGSEIRFLGGLD